MICRSTNHSCAAQNSAPSKITANGHTYALFGEAGALARSLTEEQFRELTDLAALPKALNLGSRAGSLYKTGRGGRMTGHLNYGAEPSTATRATGSMTLMPQWLRPLEQAGARVQH